MSLGVVNRPGNPGGFLVEVTLRQFFVRRRKEGGSRLGSWHVANVIKQPVIVAPVDPLERCVLGGVERASQPLGQITSALKGWSIDSARALLKLSPTLPTEG